MCLDETLPKFKSDSNKTRVRSKRQEQKLAKDFGGRVTVNSGAKFSENDVLSADFDIEAKTTGGKGYRITVAELKKIRDKAHAGRVPIEVIEFSEHGETYVVIALHEFFNLIGKNKLR